MSGANVRMIKLKTMKFENNPANVNREGTEKFKKKRCGSIANVIDKSITENTTGMSIFVKNVRFD